MKKIRIIYYVSMGLLSVMMIGGPLMYFFKYDEVSAVFTKLGYPTYLIYPLAVAKLLGLVAIWTRKVKVLKDLAYAGFFYDFVLALLAHIMVADGEYAPAIFALVFVCASYYTGEKIEQEKRRLHV